MAIESSEVILPASSVEPSGGVIVPASSVEPSGGAIVLASSVEPSGGVIVPASSVEPSGGAIVPGSSPVSRKKSIGNGTHCHQCRQNRENAAACKNKRNNKQCFVRICTKCLLNRYGEKVEEVATLEQWSCPKCRGICNCSICRKSKGEQPTGILITNAKAAGFSSVSEMLLKSAECTDMTADPKKGIDISSIKEEKEDSVAGKLDADFQNLEENKKNIKRGRYSEVDKQRDRKKPKKAKTEALEENGDVFDHQIAECLLPVGADMTSVAEIETKAEDVGNALQFLEFCSVFGKIIDVKSGEAEYILEDVLKGQSSHRGKHDVTIQFHLRLLTVIPTDKGEKGAAHQLWFDWLKKCLSESKHISKEPVLVSLANASDYDALSASEKLRILNLLCDEVLNTEKARGWINQENLEFRRRTKEVKEELRNAQRKDKIASSSESEAGQADEQSLESRGKLLQSHRECDAMRTAPILIEHGGRVYWKLNCYGKLDVLQQNVGKGDTLTADDKWFIVDNEGKEIIENYISSLRRK